jgi:hypothetical protein
MVFEFTLPVAMLKMAFDRFLTNPSRKICFLLGDWELAVDYVPHSVKNKWKQS